MRQFVLELRDLLLKLTFNVVGHPYSVGGEWDCRAA
jgi:hypothetical protein